MCDAMLLLAALEFGVKAEVCTVITRRRRRRGIGGIFMVVGVVLFGQ